jgi:endonuclease YncB( thermonuclease family)
MTRQQYIYKVSSILKVTDGDTFWMYVDVGFRQMMLVHCRLSGWDTPERNKGSVYEKQCASVAAQRTETFLTAQSDLALWVRTEKDPDNFGRWLADVWREDDHGREQHLGDHLASYGLATSWPIRWREQYDVKGRDGTSSAAG